jgi:hypothetical protein
MTVAFACSRGLASAIDSRLLGAYDGGGAWQIYLAELGNSEEQLYVEMHEGMHHELQASTGWGLVSAMAMELVIRGYRTDPLRDLFGRMVDSSRSVHEMFATAISSFVIGEDRARELLVDNVLYWDYLRQAAALVPRDQAPSLRFHHAAVTAVLRVAMSPTSALRLMDLGYKKLDAGDLLEEQNTPEGRILAYRDLATTMEWGSLFEVIAAEYPDQVDELWVDAADHPVQEGSPVFQAARIFEEEVLLPACYQLVEESLNDAGFPTIPFGAQADLANRVKAAVAAVDPELAARLRLVTERRPVADDGLEYDRQQLVLRDRLPAVVRPYSGEPADLEFLTWEGRDGPTILAVWISSAAARKQWAIASADVAVLSNPMRTLVQLGVDRLSASPVVVLTTLPALGPSQVQRNVGDATPLLVVTTLSSLVNMNLANELGAVAPVFVLMDLPVAHHVASWIAQGLDVRMAASPLVGTETELWVLAFTVAQAPAFVFLSLGGAAGVSLLIERLRRTHGDLLHIDAEVLRDHASGINLAVTRILTVWHVLDQDGTENRTAGR